MKRSIALGLLITVFMFLVSLHGIGNPAQAANIVYKSGHISISEIWTADNIYVIQDNLSVDQGVALTIEPGTIVKFAEGKLLGVHGILRIGTVGGAYYTNFLPLTLKVNRSPGTRLTQSLPMPLPDQAAQDEVIITSIRDDTAGGDTNGDGTATSPEAGDWGHIVYFEDSVDAVNLIQNAVIRYGGYFHNHGNDYYNCWDCQYWGPMRMESASPTIVDNELRENRGYALSASVDSFPVVSGNTLWLNDGNGLEIRQGTLSTVTPVVYHWDNTGIVYALTGFTTVGSGVTLQIDPGVIVKVVENRLIGVDGVLKVMGTPTEPITITSSKDDEAGGDTNGDGNATQPDEGDWGHIVFLDPSVDEENLIQNAVIRYGGYFHNHGNDYYNCWDCQYWGPVRMESASPTIVDNELRENRGYAFSASVDSFPVVSGNTLWLNDGNGLEIRQGTLSTVTPVVYHWDNTGIVYALTGFTTIGSGVTLQIDPGVIVKVVENRLIGVHGVLKVMGTPTEPITVTSLKDDDAGGDTNGDGTATQPESGDWGHIGFLEESVDEENLIQNAVIRYGGYFHNHGNDYYNCWDCQYWGAIYIYSTNPTIQDNWITQNEQGICTDAGAQPTITNNSLASNISYGVNNLDGSVIVDVENNWWGHVSGPYHPSNPGGMGNPVSDHVDFTPWLSSPP